MPSPSLPAARSSQGGVALVIVLAFVLLLTGLVVAFFSRAISERQISNGSANQVKVDVLAQGAANTVIGDLQQEIAAGSTAFPLPAPTPTQGSATIFAPTSAGTMIPAQALASPTPSPAPPTATGLENLVKQSAGGIPFYPAANYSSNFPPSIRAAKSVNGTGASGDNNTAKPSLSGRYVSPARWNKPLLLPATSATDLTPVITVGTYVPPDWVLVARDGSNPTTWNANLTTSATSATTVTGRFAYNVYDEGGLLDANVAGYPAPAATPSPTAAPQAGSYKNALAYADLTQLTDASSNPLLTQPEIDALVGWRNSASTNAPGAFPSPAFTDTSRLNYYNSVLSNPSGFLTLGNAKLSDNKQSDRMFSGRQTLIDLMQSIAALTGSDAAKANASLRYLGTFSRGIDQPSFIPDPARPPVLPSTQGGNNAGGLGLENVINPSFLTVRVKTATAGGRFDGSNLNVGEPLMKKQFPLNRLAWLTYKGPSALNMSDPVVQATITALGGNPLVTNDPVYLFVQQGTAANIQTCFGLNWNTGSSPHWTYNVSGHGGNGSAIYKLNSPTDSIDVVRATPGREPDFFEILKASINVGSIAKAATGSNPGLPGGFSTPYAGPYQAQYIDDTSVDEAIIQIGANIIDQFDLDGYPTWINFNNGSSVAGKDIYGVENLPYLSGINNALVKVKQASQAITATTVGVKNTGVGALLQCPELWNPHDYNTNNLNQTAGVVGPTNFRIYATSGTSGVNNTIQLVGLMRSGPSNGHNQTQANANLSPGYNSQYGLSFTPLETRTLSQANTELDFSVTRDAAGATRFREPTIIFQPPSNGNSYLTGSPAATTLNFGNIANATNLPILFSGNAFKSDVDSGVGGGVPPVVGNGYVGFYLGSVPLYWADGQAAGSPAVWVDTVAVTSPFDVHYFVQYKDATGNWVTYDEKDRTIGGSGSEGSALSAGGDPSPAGKGWGSFFYQRDVAGQWDSSLAVMDPRTSRFHLTKFTAANNRYWNYPPYGADAAVGTSSRTATATTVGFTYGWLDPNKGIILAQRSGTSDGASLICPVGLFPTSMGWNPGSVDETTGTAAFTAYRNLTPGPVSGNFMCRPGMFSQNNPFLRRNNRLMGDTGDPASMDSVFGGAPVSNAAESYSDPDGVIRRATGGLVPYNPGSGVPATTDVGLPMTAANTTGVTRLSQSDSRPMILNRPFRTVGELAYTFAGTPWKNLNFTMPESGDSALLDVFCINDTNDANGLVAGKVNLNTRQAPVLQAMIAGAYKDESNPGTVAVSGTLPAAIASGLVSRTTSTVTGKGPLRNVSELVGRFVTKMDANTDTTVGGIAPSMKSYTFSPKSYDGFSADLINNTVSPATGILVTNSDTNLSIPRFANATVRALAASGQARVWNLMIDVIAQTGRYPPSATSLDKFSVEGEQRYWVHVAIDRLTGQVLDKQVEVVKE